MVTHNNDNQQQARVVKLLRNNILTLQELMDKLSITKQQAQEAITKLQEQGITPHIRIQGKKTTYHINTLPERNNTYLISEASNNQETLQFAATSDWHFASTFFLSKTWHEAMKATRDAGITKVYVAGDIVDGSQIYKGHLENLVTYSVEKQTDMVAGALSKYPELDFWGIAGNHDYSFTQQNGAKPLAILAAKAPNFKNLGDFQADVIYQGIKIRLLHGAGGRAYATSYPSQTYLRDYFKGLDREEMPNIPHLMIIGHFHTLYQGKDHGIHILQCGSFQDSSNEYCIRRGLTGPNGLFHVTTEIQQGTILSFNTKYIEPNREGKGKAFSKTTKNYQP